MIAHVCSRVRVTQSFVGSELSTQGALLLLCRS
jgi:hypothetical protein